MSELPEYLEQQKTPEDVVRKHAYLSGLNSEQIEAAAGFYTAFKNHHSMEGVLPDDFAQQVIRLFTVPPPPPPPTPKTNRITKRVNHLKEMRQG